MLRRYDWTFCAYATSQSCAFEVFLQAHTGVDWRIAISFPF